MKQHVLKHESLFMYFKDNPDLYLSKKNSTYKVIFLAIAIPAIVLAIKPELINFGGIGFRIIFVLIALFLLLGAFLVENTDFYNKISGGKITSLKFKKFSLEGEDDMNEIIDAFEDENFEALRDVPSTDDGSLRIEIHHDEKGKECYIHLKNEYYGTINYMSGVKIFKDSKYDEYYRVLSKL